MIGDAIFHYALSILEGFLAGACFCRAKQAEEKQHKVILYITSTLWFASSVLDSLTGSRALRDAKTLEINGGNDND